MVAILSPLITVLKKVDVWQAVGRKIQCKWSHAVPSLLGEIRAGKPQTSKLGRY